MFDFFIKNSCTQNNLQTHKIIKSKLLTRLFLSSNFPTYFSQKKKKFRHIRRVKFYSNSPIKNKKRLISVTKVIVFIVQTNKQRIKEVWPKKKRIKEDDTWNSQNNKERTTQYIIQQKQEALMQLANNTFFSTQIIL